MRILREINSKNMKKIYENQVLSSSNEDNKVIKYNQGEKSIKSTFIIYANLECLL